MPKKKTNSQNKKKVPGLKKVRTRQRANQADPNPYLSLLLDPCNAEPVGIPDEITVPSDVFKTEYRFKVSTPETSAGQFPWVAYAIAPTPTSGIQQAGGEIAGGRVHSVISNTATIAANDAPASLLPTVSQQSWAVMQNSYSDIRPVAMCVRFTPTQAIGSLTGVVGMRLMGGGAPPWKLDSAATVTGGLAATETGTVNGRTVLSLDYGSAQTVADLVSSVEVVSNASHTIECNWYPADPTAYRYQSTQGLSATAVGEEWHNLVRENTTLVQDVVYAAPYQLYGALAEDVAGTYYRETFKDRKLPYVLFIAEGVDGSTSLGEMSVTISWEGIMRPLAHPSLSGKPSHSIPDDIAQAANVVSSIPAASLPNVEADKNRKLISAARGLSVNQPPSRPRERTTGRNILQTIGRVASGASGVLGMIPGAGAILGPGAAMLGKLMQAF